MNAAGDGEKGGLGTRYRDGRCIRTDNADCEVRKDDGDIRARARARCCIDEDKER